MIFWSETSFEIKLFICATLQFDWYSYRKDKKSSLVCRNKQEVKIQLIFNLKQHNPIKQGRNTFEFDLRTFISFSWYKKCCRKRFDKKPNFD